MLSYLFWPFWVFVGLIIITWIFEGSAEPHEEKETEDPAAGTIRGILNDECPYLGSTTINRLAGIIADALADHK